MTLFKLETQSDSVLVEIDTDNEKLIKNILRAFLQDKDYYYTDRLVLFLQEKGFSVKKIIPIKINWWDIQPVKGTDDMVKNLLKSE